jgi:hypothetical protein
LEKTAFDGALTALFAVDCRYQARSFIDLADHG